MQCISEKCITLNVHCMYNKRSKKLYIKGMVTWKRFFNENFVLHDHSSIFLYMSDIYISLKHQKKIKYALNPHMSYSELIYNKIVQRIEGCTFFAY